MTLKEYLSRVLGGAKWFLWLLVATGPSGLVRTAVFRSFGGKIGRRSRICQGVECRGMRMICIGERTMIGTKSVLDGRGKLQIGSNVNISSEVMVWTMKHDHGDVTFKSTGAPVIIEDRVWLGPRAMIMPGVTIGEAAIVCGGAIVTRSIESGQIVAGIPARPIGQRKPGQAYQLDTNYPFY